MNGEKRPRQQERDGRQPRPKRPRMHISISCCQIGSMNITTSRGCENTWNITGNSIRILNINNTADAATDDERRRLEEKDLSTDRDVATRNRNFAFSCGIDCARSLLEKNFCEKAEVILDNIKDEIGDAFLKIRLKEVYGLLYLQEREHKKAVECLKELSQLYLVHKISPKDIAVIADRKLEFFCYREAACLLFCCAMSHLAAQDEIEHNISRACLCVKKMRDIVAPLLQEATFQNDQKTEYFCSKFCVPLMILIYEKTTEISHTLDNRPIILSRLWMLYRIGYCFITAKEFVKADNWYSALLREMDRSLGVGYCRKSDLYINGKINYAISLKELQEFKRSKICFDEATELLRIPDIIQIDIKGVLKCRRIIEENLTALKKHVLPPPRPKSCPPSINSFTNYQRPTVFY